MAQPWRRCAGGSVSATSTATWRVPWAPSTSRRPSPRTARTWCVTSNGHCPWQLSSSPWDSFLARLPAPSPPPYPVTPMCGRGTCINPSAHQNRGRPRETLPPGAHDHELQSWTLLGPWERHRLYVWVLSPGQANLQPTNKAPILSQNSYSPSMPQPSRKSETEQQWSHPKGETKPGVLVMPPKPAQDMRICIPPGQRAD